MNIPPSLPLTSVSSTIPMPPAPSNIPLRRASKGSAASDASEAMLAAPSARNPFPIHGRRASPEASSPAITTMRSHRPSCIMSCQDQS